MTNSDERPWKPVVISGGADSEPIAPWEAELLAGEPEESELLDFEQAWAVERVTKHADDFLRLAGLDGFTHRFERDGVWHVLTVRLSREPARETGS